MQERGGGIGCTIEGLPWSTTGAHGSSGRWPRPWPSGACAPSRSRTSRHGPRSRRGQLREQFADVEGGLLAAFEWVTQRAGATMAEAYDGELTVGRSGQSRPRRDARAGRAGARAGAPVDRRLPGRRSDGAAQPRQGDRGAVRVHRPRAPGGGVAHRASRDHRRGGRGGAAGGPANASAGAGPRAAERAAGGAGEPGRAPLHGQRGREAGARAARWPVFARPRLAAAQAAALAVEGAGR